MAVTQRENVELFLKGCESYGLKSQDLFQVNDLYEHKNLYMVSVPRYEIDSSMILKSIVLCITQVIDCIYALGGMVRRAASEFD